MRTLSEDEKRQLDICELFQSAGWKIFEEHIQELLKYHEQRVADLTVSTVKAEDLPKLNDAISNRWALQRVLDIKSQLVEELETEAPSPVEA